MPRLLDTVLEAAVYLYPDIAAAEEGTIGQPGGTGFLIAASNSPQASNYYVGYVVTAKHVIDSGATVVRLNAVRGGVEILDLTERDWISASDGTDIAVAVVGLDERTHQAKMIMPNNLLTRETMERAQIGIGDDIALVGRFINHEGKQKNLPTVRFGSIAQMPYEKISGAGVAPQESFLVEVRAIGGYSGSPVFVHVPPWRSVGEPIQSIQPHSIRQTWLLGIEWCMLPDWVPIHDAQHRPTQGGSVVPVNTGMCGVIPAWKIGDLLKDDRVKSAQNAIEKAAPKAPPPAAILTGSARSVRNPSHKEDFTAVLGVAAKKQKPADQT